VGVSAIVGPSNKSDIDEDDLLTFFEQDDSTQIIAQHCEDLKDCRALAEVASWLSPATGRTSGIGANNQIANSNVDFIYQVSTAFSVTAAPGLLLWLLRLLRLLPLRLLLLLRLLLRLLLLLLLLPLRHVAAIS
jgi:hypothetical protein